MHDIIDFQIAISLSKVDPKAAVDSDKLPDKVQKTSSRDQDDGISVNCSVCQVCSILYMLKQR